MKSNFKNLFLIKKATLFLLVFLALFMSSCASDEDASSFSQAEESSADESSVVSLELPLEDAKKLIEKDKKIIDIFINGSLSQSKSPAYESVPEENEFHLYSSLESLLSSTYSIISREIDFFQTYPTEELPAVKNSDGKTSAFFHTGSSFSDYADISSVRVENTETDTVKSIKLKCLSGREVTLKAVYENNIWLLEKGLYNSIDKGEEPKEKPLCSGKGSFSSFNGDILVIELFISDSNSSFDPDSDEPEKAFHEKIKNSFDYLLQQCEGLGGNADITYESVEFEHFGAIGSGDLPFDVFFSDTGFGNLRSLAESHFDDLQNYDNYVFAVCFNRETEPLYKLNDGKSTTELYFAERTFVGTNTTSEDIARNVLALSGGEIQHINELPAPLKELYSIYFPQDIYTADKLENAKVNPYTAYCCGMTEELNPIYRVFINKTESLSESEE